MARNNIRSLHWGWQILLGVVSVLVSLAVIFLVYCGLSALFTGSGFVDTMSDTWCTIFGLVETVTEPTQEIVEPVVEAII